jgi:3-oxoacyl-[acyl-carrier-protein] synthase-3
VKNACNSVATAIDIANAMIIAGTAKKVLIVSGEKPSDSIKLKGLNKENIVQHFAALSFGDAGVAIEIEGTEEEKGILYSKSKTFGKYWNLCNVLGGGSMYPQDASKLVFSGDTYKLKTVMDKVAPDFIHSCMAESGYALEDVDLICSHQVSKRTASTIHQHLNIGLDRIMQTFQKFGNTASTSMPIALEQALAQGKAKKGDLIMLLGLAAGINVSVQLVRA